VSSKVDAMPWYHLETGNASHYLQDAHIVLWYPFICCGFSNTCMCVLNCSRVLKLANGGSAIVIPFDIISIIIAENSTYRNCIGFAK